MLLTFNSWRGGPNNAEGVLYAPMMAPKFPRPSTFKACEKRVEGAENLPVRNAQPLAVEACGKPPPLCWCPQSGPGKLSFCEANDRLNPGRAFYRCGKRSCSFFAWRVTNEEYKKEKEALNARTEPVGPETTTATKTKKKAKGTHKKEKNEAPLEDFKESSTSDHKPYVCSTPITIPTRSSPFRQLNCNR